MNRYLENLSEPLYRTLMGLNAIYVFVMVVLGLVMMGAMTIDF